MSVDNDEKLFALIMDYWNDFHSQLEKEKDHVRNGGKEYIAKPSIPIVWFGDMAKCRQSPLRIITVALNPSRREFPAENSFSRFMGGDKIWQKRILNRDDLCALHEMLSGYFSHNPYKNWFLGFEKVLNKLDASYYGSTVKSNTAVHIDICTAIATDPTWGKLDDDQISRLIGEGNESLSLFKRLLEYLNPNVVLFSSNKTKLREGFGLEDSNIDRHYSSGRNGFGIDTYMYNDALVIKGRNNRGMPFGLKNDFVEEAMSQINDHYKKLFGE